MMRVYNNVKVIRWQKGLTIRDLARLSGISHSTIYRIENGLSIPNQLQLVSIAHSLGLPTEEVFTLDWKSLHIN